jgi:hypothetical protein
MAAFIALAVSIPSLSWAWISAARSEFKSSQSTERSDREKARLAVIRSNLQGFYVEGGTLMDRPLPNASEPEIAHYVSEADAWATKANTWIHNELGQAASARFQDRTAYPGRSITGIPPALSNARIFIADLRQNLTKMIETNAWDASTH